MSTLFLETNFFWTYSQCFSNDNLFIYLTYFLKWSCMFIIIKSNNYLTVMSYKGYTEYLYFTKDIILNLS